MKLLTTLLALGLALSTPAFAGKGNKEGKAGKKEVAAAIKGADKNGNHVIDSDEVAGLQDAIAKAAPDSPLKKLDADGDGKLSEDEVKAINAKLAAHAEGGKKKKNK